MIDLKAPWYYERVEDGIDSWDVYSANEIRIANAVPSEELARAIVSIPDMLRSKDKK